MEPGAELEVTRQVEEHMTAAALVREEGQSLARVLATPMLVLEIENAAEKLMRPLIPPGHVSVGAKVEISHLAPTPVGALLTTRVRFTGQEGRLWWFDVTASDEGGVVGAGRHARAIVPGDGIEERARKRVLSQA